MADDPACFGLIEPFETDDLSCTPDCAFALGVEWEIFRQKLLAGGRFTDLVLNENARRIEAMCERHDRFVESHPIVDGWTEIIVGGEKT